MNRKNLLLCVLMAFAISACGWHMPFFGGDKVEEDKPLVQDATQVDEEPQYSGQLQAPDPNMNPYKQPAANAGQYTAAPPANGQPPAAYGQQPYGQPGAAAPAFQAGQPYNPNTNYALNASPGAYGAGTPANNPGAANFNSSPAPANSSYFGTPQNNDQVFVGIKRKALYIISYPHRGLATAPQDQFSQNIYQNLAQAPGINLIPKETIDRYSDTHNSISQSSDTSVWLSKMGQALGAQAIILEKVSFTNNLNPGAYAPPTQKVELQLIDTATGYPIKSYNLDSATPGAGQIVNSLSNYIRMIDWSARVIKVEKKRILINAGRFSGLETGQNLRVYAKGSEIKDPTSKMSLGKAQGVLKGTVKIIDFFGLDGAICEPLKTNSKFKVEDMVKAAE